MSGLRECERLGLWLAENPHDIIETVRCPERDGRVLVKVVEVEGLRFIWCAPTRVPGKAWTDELSELRADLLAADMTADDLTPHIEAHVSAGERSTTFPPQAYPADRQLGLGVLASCPGCRRHYAVSNESGVLSVSRHPMPPTS